MILKHEACIASICVQATHMIESPQLLADDSQIADAREEIFDDLTSAITAESAALVWIRRTTHRQPAAMLMIHRQETITLFERTQYTLPLLEAAQ